MLSPCTPKSLKWLSQVFRAQFSVFVIPFVLHAILISSPTAAHCHTVRPALWLSVCLLFSARQLSSVATARCKWQSLFVRWDDGRILAAVLVLRLPSTAMKEVTTRKILISKCSAVLPLPWQWENSIKPLQPSGHYTGWFRKESAILWEMILCVILSKKVHMNMGPILDGYGVMTAWNLE